MKPISNRLYDWLKWIVVICIPALTTAYVGLDSIFGWGHGEVVAKCSAILCTLLGTLLGISTAQYNRQIQPPDETETPWGEEEEADG